MLIVFKVNASLNINSSPPNIPFPYTLIILHQCLQKFRSVIPDLTLSTDFIVGYPTETDEYFQASLRLLREIFSPKVNITRFSPRPGTPAAGLPNLPGRVKKERSRLFTREYHRIVGQINHGKVGSTVDVMVTEKGLEGGVVARDSSYDNPVVLDDLPLGSRHRVRIVEARKVYLIGERIS